MRFLKQLLVISCSIVFNLAFSQAKTITLLSTQSGESLGTVQLEQTHYGVLITPKLHGLTHGTHGFHLHENPSCAQHGNAAGGHYDPGQTHQHRGPYHAGHLGDLPALSADQQGQITLPVVAPRLILQDFDKHALIIHQGGDNYSDQPQALGGGGKRVACAVIAKVAHI